MLFKMFFLEDMKKSSKETSWMHVQYSLMETHYGDSPMEILDPFSRWVLTSVIVLQKQCTICLLKIQAYCHEILGAYVLVLAMANASVQSSVLTRRYLPVHMCMVYIPRKRVWELPCFYSCTCVQVVTRPRMAW